MNVAQAARDGDVQQVVVLLAAGADPNERDEAGVPALHWAVSNDSDTMLRVIVTAGGDVNQPDRHGRTALSYARQYARLRGSTRSSPIIHALLLLGAR